MGEVSAFEFGVHGSSSLRSLVSDLHFAMHLFNRDNQHTLTVLSLDPLTILCISTSVHVTAPEMNEYHRNVLS